MTDYSSAYFIYVIFGKIYVLPHFGASHVPAEISRKAYQFASYQFIEGGEGFSYYLNKSPNGDDGIYFETFNDCINYLEELEGNQIRSTPQKIMWGSFSLKVLDMW